MSNTVVTTITVIGERRHEIKDLFERSSVPTSFGLAWVFPEYGTVLLCDGTHGDGITVEEDAILIRGESKNSPPLEAIQKMSMERPGLAFFVHGKDVANSYLQRWLFYDGEGRLLDCVQGAYEGEGEEIVYMLDGKQFLKLPEWVAVDVHAMSPAQDDQRQDIPESPFPFGRSVEIHGELGAPCPDYVPTKNELDLLARHWAGVKVEIEDFWQIHEQVGSSDMRQNAYANLRLRRMAKHLGDAVSVVTASTTHNIVAHISLSIVLVAIYASPHLESKRAGPLHERSPKCSSWASASATLTGSNAAAKGTAVHMAFRVLPRNAGKGRPVARAGCTSATTKSVSLVCTRSLNGDEWDTNPRKMRSQRRACGEQFIVLV